MRVANTFTSLRDGRPATYGEVLQHVSRRIARASRRGSGYRLSACEVRALDYAVIRMEGGIEVDSVWLDGPCAAGNAND